MVPVTAAILIIMISIFFLPQVYTTCETRSQPVIAWYRAGSTSDEFLTTNQNEMLINGIPAGRVYRGIVGYLWTSMPPANGIAMNRYNSNNIGHFYSTNSTVLVN